MLKKMMLSLLMVVGFSSAVYAGETEARIPVTCTAEGSEQQYSFKLEPEEESEFQTIENNVLSLKDGEAGEFRIQYTYPGTFHYKVYQLAGEDKDITYDNTEYVAAVYVTEDEDGVMDTETIVFKTDERDKYDGAGFLNILKKPTPTVTPAAPVGGGSGSVPVAHTGDANVAKTGDTTNIVPIVAVFAAGLMVFIAALVIKKKKRA